ncbi:MAG: alpha/beta hydrolase [Gallionella sp.]
MASVEKIYFAGRAGQLAGVLHLPDAQPLALALIAHPLPTMGGTMEHKIVTTLARGFVELGYAALRFNFRGVGESAGEYDQGNGETDDAIAAADFLRTRYPDLDLLCAGFSFGGYVQARAAAVIHPSRLVLIAPAVGRFAMPEVAANTLVIHGDEDEVVPFSAALAWAKPQQLPIIVLAGAGHFFHGRMVQLKQIVMQQIGIAR